MDIYEIVFFRSFAEAGVWVFPFWDSTGRVCGCECGCVYGGGRAAADQSGDFSWALPCDSTKQDPQGENRNQGREVSLLPSPDLGGVLIILASKLTTMLFVTEMELSLARKARTCFMLTTYNWGCFWCTLLDGFWVTGALRGTCNLSAL